MKIKLKTLKSVEYLIDVQQGITVAELKNAIETEHSFEASSLKLLFNGVVLEDKSLLEQYSIKDGAVLILMTSKIKKKNEEKVDDNNNLGNVGVSKEIKLQQPAKQQASATDKVKPTTAKPEATVKFSSQLKQLSEMGFDHAKSLQALNAANGNVDLAVEYLYNGIPSNENDDDPGNEQDGGGFLAQDDDPQDDLSEEHKQDYDGEGLIQPHVLDNLDLNSPNALSNIASIIKLLIAENPSVLQELMERVGETNPEILEFIRNNEAQFKVLMSQPITEDDFKVLNSAIGVEDNAEASASESEAVFNQYDELTKDFTEKDKESIKNLVGLGFGEADAIQAYIACDKNEEAAANFLLQDKF